MPITPETGSLFHAETQDRGRSISLFAGARASFATRDFPNNQRAFCSPQKFSPDTARAENSDVGTLRILCWRAFGGRQISAWSTVLWVFGPANKADFLNLAR